MTERSISFSTPMVQAIAAGRKTVTRRVVGEKWGLATVNETPLPSLCDVVQFTLPGGERCNAFRSDITEAIPCPYGEVGDVLKVKEAAWLWCEKREDGLTAKGRPKFRYVADQAKNGPNAIIYAADVTAKPKGRFTNENQVHGYRLKIPRFLPAWAVRTRLKITGIRVERLQDITEEQARAEGVPHCLATWGINFPWNNGKTPRDGFINLWNSINGPDSWAANPWVWAISFEVVK